MPELEIGDRLIKYKLCY